MLIRAFYLQEKDNQLKISKKIEIEKVFFNKLFFKYLFLLYSVIEILIKKI